MPERLVYPGGYCFAVEAIRLAVDLEAQGFVLAVSGESVLVSPRARLSREMKQAITAWKPELLRILRYCTACDGTTPV